MDNSEMDKYERRRLRLIELRDAKCGGKIITLANKIGRDASFVSRMLYPANKNNSKHVGDNVREVIEIAFGLPSYWLDQMPGTPDHALPMHKDESIQQVIKLMESTTENTRIEICGIVRNYIININSKDEIPQKIVGRTGTHS